MGDSFGIRVSCEYLLYVLTIILKSVKVVSCCFFFNDTATTEIYTLSLHDALPISLLQGGGLLMIRLLFRSRVLVHRES